MDGPLIYMLHMVSGALPIVQFLLSVYCEFRKLMPNDKLQHDKGHVYYNRTSYVTFATRNDHKCHAYDTQFVNL